MSFSISHPLHPHTFRPLALDLLELRLCVALAEVAVRFVIPNAIEDSRLIGVLVRYRNKVIGEGGDTEEVAEILLMVLDVYDKKKS